MQFVARSSALGNMYERDNLSPPWGGGGRGKRSGQPLKLRLGQPRWRAFILKFSFPVSKISGEDAHLLFSRHVKIYALVCTVIPPITNSGLCLRSLMT